MNKTAIVAIVIAIFIIYLVFSFAWFSRKENKIKNLEIEIGSLKTRIEVAQDERNKQKEKYDGLVKSLADAKKRKQGIKPPKDEQETKQRFVKLGYKAR